MKKILLVIILCVSISATQAQSVILDSLNVELQKIPINNDTAQMKKRARLLLYMANEHINNFTSEQDHLKGREYARQVLDLSRQLNNEKGVAWSYRTISFSYTTQGRYFEAIDTGLLTLRTFEKLRDTALMVMHASFIADNYQKMGNASDQAIRYAKLCLEWSKQASRKHGICACQAMLGNIYISTGQVDSAAYYIKAAQVMAEEIGDKNTMPSLYFSLADLEKGRQNYSAEQEYLLKAKDIYDEDPAFGEAQPKLNVLIKLLRNALNRNDFANARQYQKLAVPYVPQVTEPGVLAGYYEGASSLAEHDGQYADALRYFKLHVESRDSVNNLEKTRRITQLQMTNDFERRQAAQAAEQAREIALRDARNKQQWLIFGFISLALIGAGAFWFYAYRQKQERRRTELELANLRAQINPHFIFNCLNSIYRYTKERDTDTASRYLQKFSSLLRLVLENSRTEKITLARDLEALQLYADIEGLRFKEKLNFTIDMDPDIDPTFLEVPGMLIQPHVENAIWHGLMHRSEGGSIVVRLRLPQENLLRVEVEDNGIGRAAAAEIASKSATHQKSLGQKITSERLKSTGKLSNIKTVDLFNAEGDAAGTRIEMDIPL